MATVSHIQGGWIIVFCARSLKGVLSDVGLLRADCKATEYRFVNNFLHKCDELVHMRNIQLWQPL